MSAGSCGIVVLVLVVVQPRVAEDEAPPGVEAVRERRSARRAGRGRRSPRAGSRSASPAMAWTSDGVRGRPPRSVRRSSVTSPTGPATATVSSSSAATMRPERRPPCGSVPGATSTTTGATARRIPAFQRGGGAEPDARPARPPSRRPARRARRPRGRRARPPAPRAGAFATTTSCVPSGACSTRRADRPREVLGIVFRQRARPWRRPSATRRAATGPTRSSRSDGPAPLVEVGRRRALERVQARGVDDPPARGLDLALEPVGGLPVEGTPGGGRARRRGRRSRSGTAHGACARGYPRRGHPDAAGGRRASRATPPRTRRRSPATERVGEAAPQRPSRCASRASRRASPPMSVLSVSTSGLPRWTNANGSGRDHDRDRPDRRAAARTAGTRGRRTRPG